MSKRIRAGAQRGTKLKSQRGKPSPAAPKKLSSNRNLSKKLSSKTLPNKTETLTKKTKTLPQKSSSIKSLSGKPATPKIVSKMPSKISHAPLKVTPKTTLTKSVLTESVVEPTPEESSAPPPKIPSRTPQPPMPLPIKQSVEDGVKDEAEEVREDKAEEKRETKKEMKKEEKKEYKTEETAEETKKEKITTVTKPDPLKLQLEALLFSSGKAMEEEQLATITGASKKAVRGALEALKQDYAARETALKLFNEATSWKLLVHDEHVPLVRRIVADTELSRATMETLAVIAYHQPEVLQSKVVDLRGSNAYEHIAELERLGFIKKEKEGRSFSLRLTDKFYDYFDVEGEKGIKQVFKEVKAPEPREQQKRLEVVDIPPAPKKDMLGDLEVIDEPERPEQPAEPSAQLSEQKTAKLELNHAEENDFLAKLDRQIEEIARRNDELSQDPLFKLPEQSPEDNKAEEASPPTKETQEPELSQESSEISVSKNPEKPMKRSRKSSTPE